MTTIHRIEVPLPYAVRWVNCYYIHDSIPTLIDTGHNTDEDLEAIRSGVEQAGGRLDAIRRIIITHGHTDHIGLAGKIADLTGAEVHVHQWDRTKLAPDYEQDLKLREHAFRDFFLRTGTPEEITEEQVESILIRWQKLVSPIAEEQTLLGGEVFPFDDFELTVVHTPGHSPGSTCLLDKKSGALFSGDSLIQETICNPAAEQVYSDLWNGYNGLAAHKVTLDAVKSLTVRQVYPGHGRPFTNLSKRLALIGTQHEKRRNNLINLLQDCKPQPDEDSGLTVFQLVRKLFPNFNELAGFVNLSGVRAHLGILAEEGIAACRNNGKTERYYMVDKPNDC